MFDAERKVVERMKPLLQRVLIADPNPASARMLDELLRDISRAHTWTAPSTERALKLAASGEPQIIFVELLSGEMDGLAFTRQLRRSKLPCRQAPVIMVTGTATAAAILSARDAGVHEFLRKPFSLKDLLRRLEAVTLRHRDWVEAMGYVGPDRRRFNSGDYSGALKRGSDAPETPAHGQILQALKILRVAVAAIERDPEQAMRAMITQAASIQEAALVTEDLPLSTAAAGFYRYLSETVHGGAPVTREILEPRAAALLAFLPKMAEDRAAA